jgi:hypothetical protein
LFKKLYIFIKNILLKKKINTKAMSEEEIIYKKLNEEASKKIDIY